jgi:hypothetical protein
MGVAFASAIRKRVPWLGIYGIGAMKSLRSYSFADGYITQSHFVNPFYGRFRDPDRKNNGNQEISWDDIMNELVLINQNILAIELQSTLSRWFLPNTSGQHVESRRAISDPINGAILREEM